MVGVRLSRNAIARIALITLFGGATLLLSLSAARGVDPDLGVATAIGEFVRIRADATFDGTHTIYRFDLTHPHGVTAVAWDFGDGGRSSARSPVWVYRGGGTYVVGAAVTLESGKWVRLQPATVRVGDDARPVAARVPARHITVDRPGAMVALPLAVARVNATTATEGFTFEGRTNGLFVYTVDATGFFRVEGETAASGAGVCHLFVSPTPSIHTDRSDIDWYRTQYGTGLSNCGPTAAAMAVTWATGNDIPVRSVREFVGWRGNGAVELAELQRFLESQGVRADIVTITEPDEIMEMIDRDHLVGVIYDMAGLPRIADPTRDLFGQYYSDAGGHYLVIKGYTVDRRYVIVYDPIPSDWSGNRVRYADGTSMLGRNRYYPVDKLFAALRTRQVLEVRR